MLTRLKQWLLFQPLKRKIIWVIMAVVVMTVVSVSSFLYWHNSQQHRQNFIRNTLILVKLVAEYTTLPLVFDDKTGAREQLDKLFQDPRVIYARLADANGTIMTDFDPFDIAKEAPSLDAQQEYRWQDHRLYFAVPVNRNQQRLGTLSGAFRLDEYHSLQRSELAFISVAVLVAVILSLMMSLLLRRFVMSSISQLEAHARRIAKDPEADILFAYPKRRNDEISQLYEAFNVLMQQVRNREAVILQLNASLENKVRQRTNALTAALKIKSAFLANMSHEIRTPMNAILGMLHLALQTELLPAQRNYITKANDAAKWLLGIINDILDYSKLESGKVSLELNDFRLESIVNYLRDVATPLLQDKPVLLRFCIDPDIPPLIGDQLRLGQVLLNLISNAIKFTQSGAITVQIKQLAQANQHVTLEFSVSDTGIGINEEQQQDLFAPFTQADNSTTRQYGGTGLGLTICKELVEAMGGHIQLESHAGFGSRFWFTLELGLSHTATPNKPETNTQALAERWAMLKGVSLLVVEDNLVNQELVLEILGKLGLKVDVADNGAEAVAMVEKNRYAAVLMDCLMPVMDGFIATQTIRDKLGLKDLPIIAMTANVMTEQRERCLASGMNDHIGKPIHWDELLEKLEYWINAKSREVSSAPETKPEANLGGFPVLPEVDLDLAWQCVSGNASLYWKLLRTVQNRHADSLKSLKSAYQAGATASAAEQAHALSGALSAIGASKLAKALKELQELFNQNADDAVIEPLMEQTEIAFARLLAEIDRLCG